MAKHANDLTHNWVTVDHYIHCPKSIAPFSAGRVSGKRETERDEGSGCVGGGGGVCVCAGGLAAIVCFVSFFLS